MRLIDKRANITFGSTFLISQWLVSASDQPVVHYVSLGSPARTDLGIFGQGGWRVNQGGWKMFAAHCSLGTATRRLAREK